MRLILLLAVALMVSAVQCVTACAQEDCGTKSQPCHHHDSSPQAKCAHEIPAAKTTTIVSTVAIPVAVHFVHFTIESLLEQPPAPALASPAPPLLTLRI